MKAAFASAKTNGREELLLIRRGRHAGVNQPQKPGLLRKVPRETQELRGLKRPITLAKSQNPSPLPVSTEAKWGVQGNQRALSHFESQRYDWLSRRLIASKDEIPLIWG
jgi:hypothetical protein